MDTITITRISSDQHVGTITITRISSDQHVGTIPITITRMSGDTPLKFFVSSIQSHCCYTKLQKESTVNVFVFHSNNKSNIEGQQISCVNFIQFSHNIVEKGQKRVTKEKANKKYSSTFLILADELLNKLALKAANRNTNKNTNRNTNTCVTLARKC